MSAIDRLRERLSQIDRLRERLSQDTELRFKGEAAYEKNIVLVSRAVVELADRLDAIERAQCQDKPSPRWEFNEP